MPDFKQHLLQDLTPRPLTVRLLGLLVALTSLSVLNGCATVTNPVGDGVPVRRLPPEVFGKPRQEQVPILLTTIRQNPPDVYRLDAGDILGVWIEGVLGQLNQAPPILTTTQGNLPPSIGYPIPVREDGAIMLPFVDPISVKGLTIAEALAAVRKAYTETKQILKPGSERMTIDLMRPRQYKVLVIREDSGGLTFNSTSASGGGIIGSTKRGTGYQLELPAYENDVLNALARTGGFPGLDAKNEVIIERTGGKDLPDPRRQCSPDGAVQPGPAGGRLIRIPLRLRPEETLPFKEEDIVLRNGDILYIEARDTEVFYTAGLLGSGQFLLPRDYDLDIVQAIALARGPLVSGNINQNNNTFSGNLSQSGLGTPSPSLVTIIRKTPGGGQLNIKVDLNRALRDPRERVLIKPQDIIVLQSTVGEAVATYFTQVFHLDFLGTIIRQRDLIGTATLSVP